MSQTTSEILEQIQEARSNRDDKTVERLAAELTEQGVYPVTPYMQESGTTAAKMVAFYGARWHEYKGVMRCPGCFADLRDTKNGPPFGRAIGVYSRERDATVAWECPDCSNQWPRGIHDT